VEAWKYNLDNKWKRHMGSYEHKFSERDIEASRMNFRSHEKSEILSYRGSALYEAFRRTWPRRPGARQPDGGYVKTALL
jgi:hypothetical protein